MNYCANGFSSTGASVVSRNSFRMNTIALSLVASFSLPSVGFASNLTHAPTEQPNILLIMADDLGYSDLSAYGSEISTPNIDAIASQGRILTNFHTAAVCSPTRASLMTGVDHHLAGIGNMGEVVGINILQNKPVNAPWGKSSTYDFDNIPEGYRGHLSEKTATMPELLSDADYHTYMVGKWHLSYDVKAPDKDHKTWYRLKKDALPFARGFDKSFTLVNGGGSHFAPSMPPTPLDITIYAEDDRVFPSKMLPKDFFSTEFYTNKLIEYIESNREDGKPFFAYAAYTAPHWPLQAPQEYIDAQKGRYDAGYDVIKQQRLKRMKQLGLIDDKLHPAQGSAGLKHWDELSAEEKQVEAKSMEIYAAMVTNLDDHVGRLMSYLKDIGEYDNTMVIFMSDNGAEGAPAYLPNIPGTKFDNSLENMGKPSSVVAYGPSWAEVGSAPFRLFKGFTGAEGGTASPLIVKLAGQTESKPISTARMQVVDMLPTLLEAANVEVPGEVYKGKSICAPKGVSFLSALEQSEPFDKVHTDDTVLADELMGASYVVRGKWKLAQQAPLGMKDVFTKDVPFALYDLSKDRGETKDLSDQYPEVVSELKEAYREYIRENKVIEHSGSYSGR